MESAQSWSHVVAHFGKPGMNTVGESGCRATAVVAVEGVNVVEDVEAAAAAMCLFINWEWVGGGHVPCAHTLLGSRAPTKLFRRLIRTPR
eukprot:5470650-Prymnesium_polylepis.1